MLKYEVNGHNNWQKTNCLFHLDHVFLFIYNDLDLTYVLKWQRQHKQAASTLVMILNANLLGSIHNERLS